MTEERTIARRKARDILVLAMAAAALFCFKIPILLNDPFFIGDSGIRMANAGRIIITVGGRTWLPLLQSHIHAFYKLGLPYWAFKFIPAFYFLLAVAFLGLLIHRILDEKPAGLLFALFAMTCFSYNHGVAWFSVNLYQEIIEACFFYLLLLLGMLDLRKRLSLLVIGGLALLTRDTFCVYLLVLSIINFRKIASDKRYLASFAFLWSVLALWSLATPIRSLLVNGRWPKFPYEWPIMVSRLYEVNHLRVLKSILISMQRSRVEYMILGLVAALSIIVLYHAVKKTRAFAWDGFDRQFAVLSLSSLAVIYGLFLYFDPMQGQASHGNPRLCLPLVWNLFIWAGIIFKKARACPWPLRIGSRGAVVIGLMASCLLYSGVAEHLFAANSSETTAFFGTIERFGRERAGRGENTAACMIMPDDDKYNDLFLGPTLYMERRQLTEDSVFFQLNPCTGCDIVVTRGKFQFVDIGFSRFANGMVRGVPFAAYRNKSR